MVGTALGRYRVIEKIGSGGMGEVYRAHDDQLDRDVALKVLPTGTVADENARKLFRKEALILAKLNHPSIATIHEFGSQDGVDFLVMELIAGRSLKEILKDGPLPEDQIQRLALQLAEGLAAAHERGIIHRDLKPANLMITTDNRLKILDFGLAKLVEGAVPDQSQSATQADAIPGTLPYMAPEQLRGVAVDVRTDVYAAGAVLYEAATGQRPFTATNAAHLMECILHQTPRPPRDLNRRLSSDLQTILLKALQKEPAQRYRSILELRADFAGLKPAPVKTTTSITLELSEPPPVEMANVLFIDIVQFSMLPMDAQRIRLRELQETVRATTEFARAKSARRLIPLPTGDGMALVFFEDSESPLRCAVELTRALKAMPEMKLRMGIHSGPVYRVDDINAARNVAGGGINMAQRVMDCGDAGHILLSKAIADVLTQLSHWSSSLHDIGEVEVKHGVRIHLFSFYEQDLGNAELPSKLKVPKTARKQRVASSRRQGTPRRTAALPRPGGTAPGIADRSGSQQGSARSHTVQITVPAAPHWRWLFVAGGIFLLAVVILLIPRVRDSFSRTDSSRTHVSGKIPSLEEGKHVLVLPFDVQGDDRETLGYIAEGLGEELSRKLSALPSLHVVSASAAHEQAKKQKIDLDGPTEAIAINFGINLILHGTVQQGGGWTRISIDFDEVPSARRLFTKPFSYSAANINLLDLQNQVFTLIIRELKLEPNLQEQARAANPTSNASAYEHYLQGRHAQGRTALGFYERALQEDPRFALAYVGLSNASRDMYLETNESSWVQKALDNARQAQSLNDGLPEVHLALGDAYRKLGKTADAVAEFERAKQLAPNSDLPWVRLGRTYEDAGQRDDAINAYTKATQVNPYSLIDRNELGAGYIALGEYEKALEQFRRVIDLDPRNYFGYMNSGVVYLAQGECEKAIPEFERALQLASDGARDDAGIHSDLGTAYFYTKRFADSVRENEIAVTISPNRYDLVGNLAGSYRWSKQKYKAAQTYRTAIELATKQLQVNARDTDALGYLALYYANSGNLLRAEDYIRNARSIDPSNSDLIINEAAIRMIANQPSAALESIGLALERGYSPNLVRADPEFSGLLGWPDFQKLMRKYAGH